MADGTVVSLGPYSVTTAVEFGADGSACRIGGPVVGRGLDPESRRRECGTWWGDSDDCRAVRMGVEGADHTHRPRLHARVPG